MIGGFSIEQTITTNQNTTSKSIRCPCCDCVRAKFNGGGSFGKLRSRFYQDILYSFISVMASKNKRKQTFKEEYSRSWDFIKPSRKGENHARCTLCSADFSIAASGRYDITQHIATAKHRSNTEIRKNATEFRSNLSTPVLSETLITKMYWQAAGKQLVFPVTSVC